MYGSLTNRLIEKSHSLEPQVGVGVTKCCWSDRHAYTVVKVLSPNRILVTRDMAVRTDSNGMSEMQKYDFTPDMDAPPVTLRKNKHGVWKEVGNPGGNGFVLGVRSEYYDYSF